MKLLIKSIIAFYLFGMSMQVCLAQGSGIRNLDNQEKDELRIKGDNLRLGITPSALLNSYIGIQMNAGLRLSDQLQLNLEGGIVVSSSALDNRNTSGFRIRPSIKLYVSSEDEYRFHLSLAYHIRKTTADRTSSFSASDGSSLGILSYQQKRNVKGPALLFGVDHNLSDKIILDVGIGFGFGNLEIIDIDTPPNSFKQSSFLENDDPGNSLFPIMILNIKFQYIIA